MEEEKNCAFQYYDGIRIVSDETPISLNEAKGLFNQHYDDMVEKSKDGYNIEATIWIEMKDPFDYHKTLIHLSDPLVENGVFYEKKYIQPFKI